MLLSACTGVPAAALRQTGVTDRIARIMPIIAAGHGVSPTPVHPMDPDLAPLLQAWGSVIALDHEAEFEAATTPAAMFGWVQALIGTSVDWSAAKGLPPAQALQLVANSFLAAARMVTDSDRPIPDLLESIATPGENHGGEVAPSRSQPNVADLGRSLRSCAGHARDVGAR